MTIAVIGNRGATDKEVRYAHRMATDGLAFMLIAMVSSVLLITDYLLNTWAAIILTTLAAGWFLTFWAAIPFARRNWLDEDDEEDDQRYETQAAEPSGASRA